MKKGTKFAASEILTGDNDLSVTNLDYKFKMGFMPIASPAKRPMNCPLPRQV